LKIILAHNFYRAAGGEEHYVKSLAKLLTRKGHKVLIYSKNNKTIPDGFIPRARVSFSMFWNKKVYTELSELIVSFRPDIAHFNNLYPLITPTAYHVFKKNKIPIVQTIHNFRYMFPKSLLVRRGQLCPLCLDKRLIYPAFIHSCYDESIFYTTSFSLSHIFHKIIGSFRLVDALIFPSLFAKRYYIKNVDLKPEKAIFIPNFIEGGGLPSSKRNNYFLFAGRLSREKGILELLNHFSSTPHLNLVVIGDGSLKGEVQTFSRFKNIKILGNLPRKKVLAYMAGALATIIPSKCLEVLPTVLIESLSVGTPVVAPRLGVFKELIKDGETGFLYKLGSNEELKNLLIKIAKNKNLSKMGVRCKKEYSDKYSSELYYQRLLKVYSKLIKK